MKLRILVGLAILAGLVALVGVLLPSTYEVRRSVTIAAPIDRVHRLVGDLHQWREWMPWWDEDQSLRTLYVDASTAAGAKMSWTGDRGEGEITVTKVDPASGIDFDMVVVQSDRRQDRTGSIAYQQEGNGVRVTWQMAGTVDTPVLGGYLALLAPGGFGSVFERGLKTLKEKAEADT